MTSATRERPILFSGPMVRAILEGRKTQTRRLMQPQPRNPEVFGVSPVWGQGVHRDGVWRMHAAFDVGGKRVDNYLPCRYGSPGDRLWVREAFHSCPHCPQHQPGGFIAYRAGGWKTGTSASNDDARELNPKCAAHGWRPSIYMPRWASRITLEVTSVRVERLQDISGEGAAAEGISLPRCTCEPCARSTTMCPADAGAHVEEFWHLWDSINAKRAPWASNPWVWVVGFKLIPQGGIVTTIAAPKGALTKERGRK